MAEIVRGRCSISRAELARFVVDQFSRFASVRITLLQQSTDSPGLIMLDRGCKPVVKSRMEAW